MSMVNQSAQFITNHWQLWAMLLVVLAFIIMAELQSRKEKAKALSPQSLVALINESNPSIIDLRNAESFRKGHILHSDLATKEDFEQGRMDKYKEKVFVLVCERGLISAQLADTLRKKGFTQPMVLAGGINAWVSAHLPLIKGK